MLIGQPSMFVVYHAELLILGECYNLRFVGLIRIHQLIENTVDLKKVHTISKIYCTKYFGKRMSITKNIAGKNDSPSQKNK